MQRQFVSQWFLFINEDIEYNPKNLYIVLGLSDEMRADFHVMKDLAIYTRIAPDGRQKKLHEFLTKLYQ